MLPPSDDVNILFEQDTFNRVYEGIDSKREALYQKCQTEGVALTVMKAFAGGLLLDEKQTPFGQPMTPSTKEFLSWTLHVWWSLYTLCCEN